MDHPFAQKPAGLSVTVIRRPCDPVVTLRRVANALAQRPSSVVELRRVK